jgi:hypothetical protein
VSITTKRAGFLGVTTVAMLASAVLAGAPAYAGENSPVARSAGCPTDFGNPDRLSAQGWFGWNGDLFHLGDECSDGHSVTLYADVEPYAPNGGYDFSYQLRDGFGTELERGHNIAEGKNLVLRVCSTEGATNINCGAWVLGTA